jgi:hypothetical protein
MEVLARSVENAHHGRVRVRLLTGPNVLDELSERLDDLHTATACPVTARRPWLSTWTRCYTHHQPVAVVAEGADDRLEGAALLARRRTRGLTHVVAMGHGPSDQVRLAVRSAAAAEELGRGIADFMGSLPRPWALRLRHLPQDDAVATVLAERLGHARLVPGDVSPVTRFSGDRRLRTYVSRNHHQQVQRMNNRIRREGLCLDVAHLSEPQKVASVLDEVEVVCRSRDVEVRGWSPLHDGPGGSFFRQVILDHAERDEVELTTLRLEGQLTSYVLCFRDGRAYRMWSCRVAPAWKRYGAGRLGNNAALAHALADEHCTEFDWMRGDENYKFSMANDVEQAQDLMAWSSSAVGVVADARRRFKVQLLSSAERFAAVERVLPHVRRLDERSRGVRRRLWRAP